jgi:hypothetical protein
MSVAKLPGVLARCIAAREDLHAGSDGFLGGVRRERLSVQAVIDLGGSEGEEVSSPCYFLTLDHHPPGWG